VFFFFFLRLGISRSLNRIIRIAVSLANGTCIVSDYIPNFRHGLSISMDWIPRDSTRIALIQSIESFHVLSIQLEIENLGI